MKPTDPVPYSPEEIEESLKFWIAARASVVPMASVMPWPYPRRLPEPLMAARRCAECGTAGSLNVQYRMLPGPACCVTGRTHKYLTTSSRS
jgi:hypothetical protein